MEDGCRMSPVFSIHLDSVGLVGPFIVIATLIMQRLWTLKTGTRHSYKWDRPLLSHLQVERKGFHRTLNTIARHRIYRCVYLSSTISCQFHFFSEASLKAYGSCCCARSESAEIFRSLARRLCPNRKQLHVWSCVWRFRRVLCTRKG